MSPHDLNERRLRLIAGVLETPPARLADIERAAGLAPPPEPPSPSAGRDWPHAPLHRVSESGTYMLTCGTYHKEHHFREPDRLDWLEAALLAHARRAGWQLEAWAVFSNHYHFVGHATPGARGLSAWLGSLHEAAAIEANNRDGTPGRKVWHNYWEKALTLEASYLARLHYVHQNPVKHGLVPVANRYRWGSAAWFERTATPAQVRTIYRFKTDQLKVLDDFEPV